MAAIGADCAVRKLFAAGQPVAQHAAWPGCAESLARQVHDALGPGADLVAGACGAVGCRPARPFGTHEVECQRAADEWTDSAAAIAAPPAAGAAVACARCAWRYAGCSRNARDGGDAIPCGGASDACCCCCGEGGRGYAGSFSKRAGAHSNAQCRTLGDDAAARAASARDDCNDHDGREARNAYHQHTAISQARRHASRYTRLANRLDPAIGPHRCRAGAGRVAASAAHRRAGPTATGPVQTTAWRADGNLPPMQCSNRRVCGGGRTK